MADRNDRENGSRSHSEHQDQALEARVNQSIDRVCASARLECETFLECAERLVECSTQALLNLRQQDVLYEAWCAHTVEIRSVFESFRENLELLTAISNGIKDNLTPRQILKLQDLMPQVGEKVRDFTEMAFALSQSIADRSLATAMEQYHSADSEQIPDDLYQDIGRLEFFQTQLSLVRLEARSMLRLLTRSIGDAEGVAVLDILAGCSFRRCDLVNQNDHEQPLLSSLVERENIANACGAILTSMALIDVLQKNLFNHCIQSLASPLDPSCSFEEAYRIVCSGDDPSGSSNRGALAAVGLGQSPPRLRAHEGNAVIITLSFPSEAYLFRDAIETSLSLLVASARERFEAADIHPTMYLNRDNGVFEAGLKLTITHSDQTLPAHQDTAEIVQRHAEMAQLAEDFSSGEEVSFDLSGDNRNSIVEVSLPTELLAVSDAVDECPLDQQAECVANAFSLARDIAGTRRLRFVRKATMWDDDLTMRPAISGIILGRERHAEGLPSANRIQAMAKFIDLWLRNPGIYKEYNDTEPVDISLACPANWLESSDIVEELVKLSSLVTLGHLNLALVPALIRDGLESSSGVKVLRELRELLELNSERLAPFGKPEVFVINNIAESSGRRSLPFYLATAERGLCAVGSLAPESGETTISVFSPSVATKFAGLIAVIGARPVPGQETSGPWGKRLQDRLLAEGFALSEYLIEELRRARTTSLEPLTSAQAADIIYQFIGGAPQAYLISENYTVVGQPPVGLAIITKNDAALWTEY